MKSQHELFFLLFYFFLALIKKPAPSSVFVHESAVLLDTINIFFIIFAMRNSTALEYTPLFTMCAYRHIIIIICMHVPLSRSFPLRIHCCMDVFYCISYYFIFCCSSIVINSSLNSVYNRVRIHYYRYQ